MLIAARSPYWIDLSRTRRSGSCRRTNTSARRRRHGPLGDGPRGRLGGDHRVHDPVLLRLLGRHEEIAIGVPLDLLHGMPGVVEQDAVQLLPHPRDLPTLDVTIDVLTLPHAYSYQAQ